MTGIAATWADAPAALADPGFSRELIAWQRLHGRHTLPWQNTRDAYRIWLSEIMLQQTQVAAVIPYYAKFLARFPTVDALAAAPAEDVMAHWSGLGYYSRARNLHRCAQRVVAEYGGRFPDDPVLLAGLPGIGRSTAAAIAAFSYGARAAILDGNVKRVFARVFGIDGFPGERRTEERMWELAVALLPQASVIAGEGGRLGDADAGIRLQADLQSYTQGLMDLGATLCTRTRPACERCPLAIRCVALATGRVAELPVRKPKKAIPHRHAVMLVVIDNGQVLLQQRPGSGIWGGLLSLPELDGFRDAEPVVETPVQLAARRAAIERIVVAVGRPASVERLQSFSHAFTHFKLTVAPYRVTLMQRLPMRAPDDLVWVDTARLADAPLPSPIKKLLLALCRPDDLFAAG